MDIEMIGPALFHVGVDGHLTLAPDVAHVTADSRRVRPGSLFVALSGHHADGRAFVREALDRGAAGILAQAGTRLQAPRQALVRVPRLWYGHLAAAAAGYPGDHLQVAAITGTNGKSSVAHLAQEMLTAAGFQVRVVGTLSERTETGGLTTPAAEDLQRMLAEARLDGAEIVLVEASSHGLVQQRLAGTRILWAAVTSLGRDHLDYHGTRIRYWAAKRRLVKAPVYGLFPRPLKGVLLHRGVTDVSPSFTRHAAGQLVIAGGVTGLAEVQTRVMPGRTRVRLRLRDVWTLPVELVWPAEVLAESLETAAALAALLGAAPGAIREALPRLTPPPGRVNLYRVPGGPRVMVDYAHDPEALGHLLRSIRRRWPRSRVTAVFGGRGERDPGKLSRMGETAGRLAHRLIVTTDSPYGEDAAAIGREILAGAARVGRTGRFIADRRSAILAAVWASRASDVVVITGRGHEDTQYGPTGEERTGSDGDWITQICGAVPLWTAATAESLRRSRFPRRSATR